jgi:hypothetical protein
MKRQWVAALLLVGSHNAWAADAKYSLEDLQALQKNEGWVELVEHLGDVPPSKRNAQWEAAAEAGAVGYLGTLTDASQGLTASDDLIKRFPPLKKSKAFMAKRNDVGLAGFEACFRGGYDLGDCNKRLTEFAGNDAELNLKAGNLVIRQIFAYNAAPYFRRAMAGKAAGAAECKEETLQRATLAALGLPSSDAKVADAQAVTEVCFAELKEPIINELAKNDSYMQASACPMMLKKNAVAGLMKARCEAAVKKAK